jgi:hypothetical protein
MQSTRQDPCNSRLADIISAGTGRQDADSRKKLGTPQGRPDLSDYSWKIMKAQNSLGFCRLGTDEGNGASGVGDDWSFCWKRVGAAGEKPNLEIS